MGKKSIYQVFKDKAKQSIARLNKEKRNIYNQTQKNNFKKGHIMKTKPLFKSHLKDNL